MTIQELRNDSIERLREEAVKQRALIRGLRFTIGTREQAHVRDLRKAKRDLARIETVLKERKTAPTPATPTA
jgi:ribosomal protein L29